MRVVLLCALFIGTASAVPKSISRIVGGSTTTIEEYPYMSNMMYRYGILFTQACGGSLLTASTVLSAAHCYHRDFAFQWRVRLGSSLRSSGGTVFSVSTLILHPNYNDRTIENDVAIIRLSGSATYSEAVQPARIAGPLYHLADGTSVTASGWGALSAGGISAAQLQHVTVNLINQDLCAARYAYLKTQPGYSNWPDITPGMLCAGILDVGGKDACQGDSGGPLAHDGNVIVGVTSWGFGCADAVYPGVNARVSHYADWIAANGSS